MAKQSRTARTVRPGKSRAAKGRTTAASKPNKEKAAKPTARTGRSGPARPAISAKRRPSVRRPAKRTPAPSTGAPGRAAPSTRSTATPPEPPKPAARKPGFYEAVAVYERGVQALQRHDYPGAAAYFRTVLDKYPDERELLERARLYLRVCERETERLPAGPKSPAERVYAATMALNAGDHDGAFDHLQQALADDPENDHAHYTMAMALGMRGRTEEALESLRRAIALNPDNRGLARHDAELEMLRSHDAFRSVLDTPPAPGHRRSRLRR